MQKMNEIENRMESAFTRIEMLLKEFKQYDCISSEFFIKTTTSTPASITMNVSGGPVATPPVVVTTTPVVGAGAGLEARVTALELANQALRAEFDAFRMTANA